VPGVVARRQPLGREEVVAREAFEVAVRKALAARTTCRDASAARGEARRHVGEVVLGAGALTSRVPSGSRLMPWKRSSSTMAASRSSFSTSAPASMVVMFLLGWS